MNKPIFYCTTQSPICVGVRKCWFTSVVLIVKMLFYNLKNTVLHLKQKDTIMGVVFISKVPFKPQIKTLKTITHSDIFHEKDPFVVLKWLGLNSTPVRIYSADNLAPPISAHCSAPLWQPE